jgi:hypothetical protein
MKLKKNNRLIGVGISLFLFLVIFPAAALAVPQGINYQGYLSDAQGNPVNGNVGVTFRLWDAQAGGTMLWSETHVALMVTEGIFNVMLGTSVPITAAILDGKRYLGITVGMDSEMVPRMKLTSGAYAIRAGYAESVAGGAVTTSVLSDTAVTEPKIAEEAVSSAKLASSSVTADKIASGAVTGEKVAGGTLTAAHLQDGSGSSLDADMLDGQHGDYYLNWSNITNIPAGFADGVDDVGLTEGSDYGRSGVSSTLYEGSTALSNKYVGKSGPQMITSGDFTVNTPYGIGTASVTGVKGFAQSDTFGFGVSGVATGSQGYGVYGGALGSFGTGVYGEAANTEGSQNYGGYFTASGSLGTGVYGEATSTEPTSIIGGRFVAKNTTGRGVVGEGSSAGGDFYADGLDGHGVSGHATNTGVAVNYGGYFTASGSSGTGVYGEAANTEGGQNYGGHFVASGSLGTGVYGEATNTESIANFGGYFTASGSLGKGVYAVASGLYGTGVLGHATNTEGAEHYGGYFKASGSAGIGVSGLSDYSGDGYTYGGNFTARASHGQGVQGRASGRHGTGVYGWASNTDDFVNYGGYFYAEGWQGRGVYAWGNQYDFYAGTGNYAPFTGVHEVRFAEDMPGQIRPGMIVSVSGRTEIRKKDNGEISLSCTLPTVALAKTPMDKAVFGVLVSEGPLAKNHWHEAQDGDRFGAVNALGDGRVLVTNVNGIIEAGDYITTSAIPGYGQKQEDDLLHSYTLGKAIETVDWDSVTETVLINGRELKVYLIAVVYTSG